jgi:soluble lytic murein transglycosylase-like protein
MKVPTPVILGLACALACSAPAQAGTGGARAGEETIEAVATAKTSGGAAPTEPSAPAEVTPTIAASSSPIVAADVPYGPLIAVTARRYGIPASLFTALVWQESGFNAKARSKSGARGLTQLMPATARELGVRHIYDPAENLDGGARYLAAQIIRFGTADLALAAYNAGPNRVLKAGGKVPAIKETRQYVRNILAIEAKLRAAGVR